MYSILSSLKRAPSHLISPNSRFFKKKFSRPTTPYTEKPGQHFPIMHVEEEVGFPMRTHLAAIFVP